MANINNAINNTVGASNSGVTNTLTVTNASNTSSSQALVNVTVGGGTAGDAFTTYTVSGVTNWSQGIDNSASGDPFVISSSTTLGTSNTLTIDTAGNGVFNNTGTSAALTLDVLNSDTNAASTARIAAAVSNGSAADAFFHASINATTNYCFGIDNSDSDSLKINEDPAGVTPSTGTNLWKMTTTGINTMPLQPAFLAVNPSTLTDKTGSGGAYVLGTDALTEIIDKGGNFNTNGTFTAPVTDAYLLGIGVLISGASAATSSLDIRIITSNRTYLTQSCGALINNGGGNAGLTFSLLADMDAADTATFSLVASGGTATADIYGSTSAVGTYVWGQLY